MSGLYVVATDLYPSSRQGAAVAAALARRTGAELDFFCAVPRDLVDAGALEGLLTTVREEVSALAASHAGEHVRTSAHVAVVRDVAQALHDRAEGAGAELVVVAPQGATGWKKLVFGSVTEQILRIAPRMLLVARPRRPMPPEDILIAVDRSPGAGRALRHGLDLARALGSRVHVFWALRPPGALLHLREALDSTEDFKRARARERKTAPVFDEWVRGYDTSGLEVTTRVEEGDAAQTILLRARLAHASPIVMGMPGKSRAAEILVGSVARQVATAATQSVLLVRDRPPKRPARRG